MPTKYELFVARLPECLAFLDQLGFNTSPPLVAYLVDEDTRTRLAFSKLYHSVSALTEEQLQLALSEQATREDIYEQLCDLPGVYEGDAEKVFTLSDEDLAGVRRWIHFFTELVATKRA